MSANNVRAGTGSGGRRIGTMFGGSSETCALCGKTVYMTERLKASEALTFHKNCFKCNHCKSVLMIGNFALAEDGQIYCDTHYKQLFSMKSPSTPSSKSSWDDSETSETSPVEVSSIPTPVEPTPTPTPTVTPASPKPTAPTSNLAPAAAGASPKATSPKFRQSLPPQLPSGASGITLGNSPHPARGGPVKGAPSKQQSPSPSSPSGGGALPSGSPTAQNNAPPRPAPPQASQSPAGARGGPGGPNPGPPRGPPGGPGKVGASPKGAPGKMSPKVAPPVDPAVEALKKKEEEEESKLPPVEFEAESLVEYQDLDGLMKGRTTTSLRRDLGKERTPAQLLHVIRQLFKAVATPLKSELLRNLKANSRHRDEIIQKTSYIAATLLQESNTRVIHDLVFRHSLLDILFEMLNEPAPIETIRLCYLRDVLTNFIRYRREDVLSFLATNHLRSALPLKMIPHFDSDEIAVFFIDLLDREPPPPIMAMPKKASPKGPPPAPKAVYWSKDPEIIRALMAQLLVLQEGNVTAPTSPAATLAKTPSAAARLLGERATENAAMVLGSILERSATHSHLVKDIISMADRMTMATTNGANTAKFDRVTFVNVMKVLGQMVLCISRNWSFEETPNPKQTMLKNAVEKLMKNGLPGYQALLRTPPSTSITIQPLDIFKKSLPLSQQGPLGFVRYAIVEFFSEIIKASFVITFEKEVMNSGIMNSVIETFFLHPHNTFLHDLVYNQIIVSILIGDSVNLINHLFLDCKLLQKLSEHYQSIDHPRTSKPNSYHSFNGHLTLIASAIDSNRLLDGLPTSHPETSSLKQSFTSTWSSKIQRVIQVQTAPPKIEG